MRMGQRWALGMAMLMIPLLASCQPIYVHESGSSVGASSYAFGTSSRVHAGTFDRVLAATKTALHQLNITVESSVGQVETGQFEARLPNKGTVKITVERTREDATTVKIRVEPFGDEAESEGIQARIAAVLQGG